MGKKLFVGGLAWATDDVGLRAAFEKFGTVTEAKVISDRETGRSRGFGFVTFQDETSASDATAGMDGASLDGRTLRVNVAEDRRPPRDDRGGGYRDERPAGGGYRDERPAGGGYRDERRGNDNFREDRRGYNDGRSRRGGRDGDSW